MYQLHVVLNPCITVGHLEQRSVVPSTLYRVYTMKPRLSECSVLTLCRGPCIYICVRCYNVIELSSPIGMKDNCSLRCFSFSFNSTTLKSRLGIPLQQVFKLEWPKVKAANPFSWLTFKVNNCCSPIKPAHIAMFWLKHGAPWLFVQPKATPLCWDFFWGRGGGQPVPQKVAFPTWHRKSQHATLAPP